MAGRGPAPKPAERRVRSGGAHQTQTILRFEQAAQPRLPSTQPGGSPWPALTRRWWKTWAESPQAEHFGSTDWSFLLDTAVLHARFWDGDVTTTAPELRLRVSKFGATPEDRMRLRMQFAQADDADAKRAPAVPSSRERRGTLHALPESKAAAE